MTSKRISTTITPENAAFLKEKNIPVAYAIAAHCDNLRSDEGIAHERSIENFKKRLDEQSKIISKLSSLIYHVSPKNYNETMQKIYNGGG